MEEQPANTLIEKAQETGTGWSRGPGSAAYALHGLCHSTCRGAGCGLLSPKE